MPSSSADSVILELLENVFPERSTISYTIWSSTELTVFFLQALHAHSRHLRPCPWNPGSNTCWCVSSSEPRSSEAIDSALLSSDLIDWKWIENIVYLAMRMGRLSILTHRLTGFTSALFPVEEPISVFFFFWGVRRVPYNAGNTAGFSGIAKKHVKVECPS